MFTPESIGESPCSARRFTLGSRARGVVAARAVEEGGANRSPWGDVLLLSLLVAVPVALTLCAGYAATARSHPTDDELTVRFFSHESDFQSLVQILQSDRDRLLSLGAESYEFTDFVPTRAGTAHLEDYKVLLARLVPPTSAIFLDPAISSCRPQDHTTTSRKRRNPTDI